MESIFQVFKRAGYTTGAFGKWGLGAPGTVGDPNQQGVDEFFGYNCQLLAHNYYADHLWHNEKRVELPGNYDGVLWQCHLPFRLHLLISPDRRMSRMQPRKQAGA
mgnify:CR=1 FL=1